MPRDWDAHYSDPANISAAPDPLLTQAAEMLPPGHALDLACGAGRHALYLAALGWRVTAVDSSEAALSRLRGNSAIEVHRADLERGEFVIAPAAFDLICDFFYLQRDLFPAIREGVRPGGTFLGAIHLRAAERNPAFTLEPGELRAEFAEWKILHYSESGATARLIARRA
jgi:tellurite methyltransferase